MWYELWRTRRAVSVMAVLMTMALLASAWVASPMAGAANMAPSDEDLAAAEQAAEELTRLSDAFRAIAKVVEPSVVYISVQAKDHTGPRVFRREWRFGPGDDPRDLFRRFFEDWPEAAPGPWNYFEQVPKPYQEDEESTEDEYRPPRQVGAGSGWVWDEHGHIITNHHVVDRADIIEVMFYDGTTAKAELVGSDPKTDVAVLKVDREGLYPARRADEPVEQGDMVFAFGSPFQYRFSMSQGVVSGTDRAVGILGPEGYENFIQTDAAINPGNSGGPLTNARGEVVGMNTAIATRSGAFNGVGFAVPMDVIEPVVEALIEDGHVTRGYVGAYIGDDPELLSSFGVEKGVVIHDVMAGGPADEAGLEPGDVITEVNGRQVESARELRRLVASMRPGTDASFEIVRDGKHKTVKLTIGKLEDSSQLASAHKDDEPDNQASDARRTLRRLGIELFRTYEPEYADAQGWDYEPGVQVLAVRPGSLAAMAGIRNGMVITQVMGEPVESVDDLMDRIESLDPSKGIRLRVRIDDRRSTFIFLKMEEDRE